MDNKINKKRLFNFLSYEWIMIIVVVVASIICWELVYSIGSVKLTTGQHFKYYYDMTISSSTSTDFYTFLLDNKTFSYDVLSLDSETLMSEFDVLSTRLAVQEGDVLITEDKAPVADASDKSIRAKTRVDGSPVYVLDDLYKDALEYLGGFLKKDIPTDQEEQLNYDNLDEQKIADNFLNRMARDNRYRSYEQKTAGVEQEKQRIKKLCKDTLDFKRILELDDGAFFLYTKYEQQCANTTGTNKETYEQLVAKEKEEGRENARYGLRLSVLNGGENKQDPSKFFKVAGESTSADTIMMAFNFKAYQPDLQYECISFITTVVRGCSTILD